ncbi:MAG TPA: hypothetical protein VFL94_09730 [Actinomycetales bacterium]|nr:hypothetical protein [Actinomycetales bacterium]
MTQPPPSRVRVTSPRMAAVRRGSSRPAVREIDEETDLGHVYMRTLVRSQLRLAALVLLVVGVTLGTLPLVFRYLPSSSTYRIGGVPLPWLVLGAGVYPYVVLLAYLYVRQAEHVERDFAAALDRARGEDPHGTSPPAVRRPSAPDGTRGNG